MIKYLEIYQKNLYIKIYVAECEAAQRFVGYGACDVPNPFRQTPFTVKQINLAVGTTIGRPLPYLLMLFTCEAAQRFVGYGACDVPKPFRQTPFTVKQINYSDDRSNSYDPLPFLEKPLTFTLRQSVI